METSEINLVISAQQGDQEAFAQLVRLYKKPVYSLAFRMLHNAEDAQDLAQETFLRVYRSLGRFRPGEKFSTWVYRIATNLCIDALRKRRDPANCPSSLMDLEGVLADGPADLRETPEDAYLAGELRRSIHKAIDALPDKYRAVVILRHIHELSYEEIASVMNLPVNTIRTHLHRARERLREELRSSSAEVRGVRMLHDVP
ncbi:hypothetical protein SY88_13115 [Clostridiales bacterium PH28_bin88]|nr:hypothetical protein SY88_13115 [Clostridiales bacterium PH28_bin88]